MFIIAEFLLAKDSNNISCAMYSVHSVYNFPICLRRPTHGLNSNSKNSPAHMCTQIFFFYQAHNGRCVCMCNTFEDETGEKAK